jgi:hypothetical protein
MAFLLSILNLSEVSRAVLKREGGRAKRDAKDQARLMRRASTGSILAQTLYE